MKSFEQQHHRSCGEHGGLRPLPRAGKAAYVSYSVAPLSGRERGDELGDVEPVDGGWGSRRER